MYELRLVGGENVREGRVEICFNQAWGTICNEEYGHTDREMICSQVATTFSGKVHELYNFSSNSFFFHL